MALPPAANSVRGFETNPQYEKILLEADGVDLLPLERTGCVSTGWDMQGNFIILFVPRLGLEGTNVDSSSDLQKMRKMLLLCVQTAESQMRGSYTIVYGHSLMKTSTRQLYNLFYDFYSKLPRKYKKNISKLIILGCNSSLKMAIDYIRIFRVVKRKFFSKLVFVDDILSLQQIVPAPCLPLPAKYMYWEDLALGINNIKSRLPSLPAIFDPNLGVPLLLHDCVQFIRRHGLTKEGLFRSAGDQVACNLVQTRWQKSVGRNKNNDATIIIGTDTTAYTPPTPGDPRRPPSSAASGDLSQVVLTDIDTVAQVMKMTLSNLSEPVITFDAFETILMASAAVEAGGSEDRWMETVSEALFSMPYEHHATLTYLIDFLADVAHESDSNKMTVGNLAIVFAPTLMRSRNEGRTGQSPLQIIAEARLSHKALERIIIEETAKHALREQEAFRREVTHELANREKMDLSAALEAAPGQRRTSKISVRYVRSANNYSDV